MPDARSRLFSYPCWRRGVDYGFPADEMQAIRHDHPTIEVVHNVDTHEMSVFACGGDYPICIINSLHPWQVYQLNGMLHEQKRLAQQKDRGIQLVKQERKRLDDVQLDSVRKAVDNSDPAATAWHARAAMGNPRVHSQVPATMAAP